MEPALDDKSYRICTTIITLYHNQTIRKRKLTMLLQLAMIIFGILIAIFLFIKCALFRIELHTDFYIQKIQKRTKAIQTWKSRLFSFYFLLFLQFTFSALYFLMKNRKIKILKTKSRENRTLTMENTLTFPKYLYVFAALYIFCALMQILVSLYEWIRNYIRPVVPYDRLREAQMTPAETLDQQSIELGLQSS